MGENGPYREDPLLELHRLQSEIVGLVEQLPPNWKHGLEEGVPLLKRFRYPNKTVESRRRGIEEKIDNLLLQFQQAAHQIVVPTDRSDAINALVATVQKLNPRTASYIRSKLDRELKQPRKTERQDVRYDLAETLQNDIAAYREMNLPEWADNIATADFNCLTPEKRKIIEQEITAGAIPVFMPDRQTQLNTTVEQFKKAFRPIWIKNKRRQKVADAYLEWTYFIKLITEKTPALVEHVPDRPYISLMKPSQKTDDRTTNKIVDEQLVEFAKINAERLAVNLAPVSITNPAEYGALQTVSSRRAEALIHGSSTTLNPIDSITYTRFINLPISPDRSVPGADFAPGSSRAEFGRGNADLPDAWRGFRLSVRVEF